MLALFIFIFMSAVFCWRKSANAMWAAFSSRKQFMLINVNTFKPITDMGREYEKSKGSYRYPFIRKLKRLNTTETLPVLNLYNFLGILEDILKIVSD